MITLSGDNAFKHGVGLGYGSSLFRAAIISEIPECYFAFLRDVAAKSDQVR